MAIRWHIITTRDNVSIGNYESKAGAESRVEGKLKRKRNKDYIIVGIPEIKAGLVLYTDGHYYKTIISETRWLWLLINTQNAEGRNADPTQKETILKWFMHGKLDGGIEEYDEMYTKNAYIATEADENEDDEETFEEREEREKQEEKDADGRSEEYWIALEKKVYATDNSYDESEEN